MIEDQLDEINLASDKQDANPNRVRAGRWALLNVQHRKHRGNIGTTSKTRADAKLRKF